MESAVATLLYASAFLLNLAVLGWVARALFRGEEDDD